MGFRSHGDVVRTDLNCSVHFHEKHTIRVYLALRPFPLPQSPRWTGALSNRPQRGTSRQTRGQKRQTVEEEKRKGGQGAAIWRKKQTLSCLFSGDEFPPSYSIYRSDLLNVPLFTPGEKLRIYHQVCADIFTTAYITQPDMLNVIPSNR